MSTVRGRVGIFTRHVARKDHHCDGPHDTYFADETIHKGDTYFRSALPPYSELGNEGWWTMRLCWTCAPIELTTAAEWEAADRDRVQRALTDRMETFDEAELLRALTHLAHDPAAMDAVNDALDAVERGDA